MLEFKLQYYFELYKDTSIFYVGRFKQEFKSKHGDFPLLYELIIMIQRYQHKKYGDLLAYGDNIMEIRGKGVRSRNESKRYRDRFGNREERDRRKLKEKYK